MSEATVAATGAVSAVHLGDESEWSTPVDPTHEFTGFTGESLSAEEESITSDVIRGDRGTHNIMRGQETVSGDLNFEFSAEGLGKAIYHVLGDYVKATDVDGGAHGRMEFDSVKATPEDPNSSGSMYGGYGNGTVRLTVPLAKEHVSGFDTSGNVSAGGSSSGSGFAVVDRTGADDSLAYRNDGGAGWDYSEYSESSRTFVDSSAVESTSNLSGQELDNTDDSTNNYEDLATITLSSIVGSDGTYQRPSVPSVGGVIELGDSRENVRVYAATDVNDSNGNPTKKLWLDPTDKDPSGLSAGWANGDFVYSFACLVYDKGDQTYTTSWPNTNNSLNPGKGKFVYDFDTSAYSGVYTHHMERGRKLPTGLTIEVDRGAAVFLYSGMKGSSLSFTFDTNAVATGTATYTGHAEYAMATLEKDLLPDVSNDNNNMIVTGAEAFPDKKKFGGIADSASTSGSGTSTLSAKDSDGNDIDLSTKCNTGDHVVNLENNKIGEISSFSTGDANIDTDIGISGTGDERFAILPANDLIDISVSERTNIKFASIIEQGDREQDSANAPTLEGDEVCFAGVKNVDRFHPKFSNVDCRESRAIDNPTGGSLRPLTSFESLININGYFEEVLSADVSIENNLNEDKFILGDRRRAQMPAEGVDVTGTLSMEFDDGKNYIKFKNGELFSVEFRLIQESSIIAGENTSLIGSTDVPPQAYLLLPKCKYTGNTPNVDDDSFIEHDMPFTAKVDDEYGMSTETVMIIVNGQTKEVK